MSILLIVSGLGLTLRGEDPHGLVDAEGVFNSELATATALQTVQMCAAAECLSKVTSKGSHIGTLAASHPDFSPWQAQSRIVRHIDSARRALLY